jgi:predicted phosphodiesterase
VAIYGIIADVHGNHEALAAALGALDARGVDRIVCLGDLVGYNAEPNECVDLLARRGIEAIAGNHDLIALGRLGFERCADKPAFALRRTRRRLDEATRRFLADLPMIRIYEEAEGAIVLVHGGVGDVQEYLHAPRAVVENAARLRARVPSARICFFGHTHSQRAYEILGDEARELPRAGALRLPQGRLCFVNPGSVDAARRDQKEAQFAIFDADRWTVSFHAVGYEHEAAEAKARAGGFRMGAADLALARTVRRLRAAARAGARLARLFFRERPAC